MKIVVVLPARFCVSSLPLHFREEINFGQVRSFVAQKILFSRIRIGARGLIGVEFRACFLGILAGLNLRFTSETFILVCRYAGSANSVLCMLCSFRLCMQGRADLLQMLSFGPVFIFKFTAEI